MKNLLKQINENYIYIIFFISLGSVVGSLYFSNILGFEPCYLCWWARILIYPLLPLSLVSIIAKIKLQPAFILVLTIPGMILETYHYLVQKFGIGKGLLACSSTAPCDKIDIQFFNFITIPLLAFFAFLLINITMVLVWKYNKNTKGEKVNVEK